MFEFDGPVVGTYPPYTDPTYWNEGLKPRFRLKPQVEVFRATLTAEANVLLRKRPELVLCVLILGLLGGTLWIAAITMLGCQLGHVELVRRNFEKVVLAIILLSLSPVIWELLKSRRGKSVG